MDNAAPLHVELRGADRGRINVACSPWMMQAQTLNCPNCGAGVSSDAPQCRYCESKLATISCASCFGMLFIGHKHCPHCGAATATATPTELSVLKCPRCDVDMTSVTIGNAPMRECQKCEGLWLDTPIFKLICADRERQAVILGDAFAHEDKPEIYHKEQIRYVPCPHCRQLMIESILPNARM